MDKQTQKNLLELVKRNYGEIAADFDLTRKKDLWPELIKLSEMVKNGDRVLDVGCGNGRLVKAFENKKISYLGVDNSEKLIKLATNQRLLRRSAPRNDKWVVADILELDKLPERDFDYVFCIAVLHHLPGKDLRLKALEQIKNKIKPGGKIILTVWNLWSQKKFRKLIIKYDWFKLIGKNQMAWGDILFDWKNAKGEKISRRYYHVFTGYGLKKLAGETDLKIEKLYQDRHNYYLILHKST
ncbi:MAG: hypothetical protein AUK20_02125, partial [Parcubacteria group bacterium CG2_30_45_37]